MSLESELQTLKSSSSTSTAEVEALKNRISSLESANRDTLSLLQAKTTANDSLAQDLQKQHQKGVELSQQITSLQQSVQSSTSAASSSKFREQSLKQELELAKRNSEWFENELKTKNAESAKYRKEKSARISELQRQCDDANSNVDAMRRTELALRSRLDEMQKKVEESLSKAQQLQESAAKTEEGYRQESETARRLGELQAQQAETHKNRVKELEAGFEKVKASTADEVGRARQEMAAEQQQRETAEQRIAELEAEVDRLEALASTARAPSVPGTPRPGLNGSVYGRGASPSPFATPGSIRSKSAVTATQALEELYKVKGQLTAEKRRAEQFKAELDDLLQIMEVREPEREEQQAEIARIQQELMDMSKYVDQTNKERERAKKDARKAEAELANAKAESKILRQQLTDLSAQLKMLLFVGEIRERGWEDLSADEQIRYASMARGDISDQEREGMSDTDVIIAQQRVFKNVAELQEQNVKWIEAVRKFQLRWDEHFEQSEQQQAAKDHEAVQQLNSTIAEYKDELASLTIRSESYIKERDMFRRMLQHRGQLPADTDLATAFGQSINDAGNGDTSGKDTDSLASLLREHQAHFDSYREEQAIDRQTLKEQAERLSNEKVSLQAEVARLTAQLAHAGERLEMLQANYNMLQNENKEMQKRSQSLSEAAAKQDIRTQQVAEDLVEAKSLVESMRNENSNLKAEKNLWKDIQDRLTQDNESLINERSRLNNLVASQQQLQNERELSDGDTRRRLQSQVETLEAELSSTRRKLTEEQDESKKAQQRREYDAQQHQKRVDELAASLGNAREEMAKSSSSHDRLQSEVNELSIQLKSANERAQALQPRPTPRPGTNTVSSNADDNTDTNLSSEQELAIKVSDLSRDLEMARTELNDAKVLMERYKNIGQGAEEELQSFTATHEEYREEMDRLIEEKDNKIQDLQQRADDIASELTSTNNELTALRNDHGEKARRIEEDKAILQAEIDRLKDDDERHATAAQFHQQDLRAQAAIATKAQQDYENELVKHAEAAKALQNLRAEHNQLKTETASLKADAESSRLSLNQGERSWEERREQYETELKELKARRDDANAQNRVLHQQLESVSSQIATLQQNRSAGADDGSTNNGDAGDRNSEGLRELNSFLRREKEIVEVQYELKVQEAKRLQQQYEYAQSQLDETRMKLEQARQQQASSGQSSMAHQDLMEKLNELNVFRESSITLRHETRQAQAQLAEKTKRVEELVEQIQPLETKIKELEHNKEITEGETQLLQADRDRWQKRTQDIISKYDRIDPAEMESLKESIQTLQSEKEVLVQEQQPLRDQIQAFENEKAAWLVSRQKIVDQAKERNRVNGIQIKDRTTERDTAVQEKDALQQQLTGLQQDLETAQLELQTAQQDLQTVTQERDTAQQQVESLSNELATLRAQPTESVAPEQQSQVLETPAPASTQTGDNAELEALRQERDNFVVAKQTFDGQLSSLQAQLIAVQGERDAALADATDAKAKLATLQAAQLSRADEDEGQINESSTTGLGDVDRQALEQRVIDAENRAKEQEEKATKLEADVEATLKTRSEKMKAALNKKLLEARESQRTEIRAELEADYNLKLEQEKKILAAEAQVAATVMPVTNDVTLTEQKPAIPPANPNASQSTAPNVFDPSSMTDIQVKDFISSNPTVKAIVASNIKKKIEQEQERIKQEHEKDLANKLAEAQQKAETAKTQAVSLESKKSALKLSMSDNRAKLATLKLDFVKTAATETPQKPVVEVWTAAKDLKMPVATPAAPAAPAAPSASPNQSAAPSTSIQGMFLSCHQLCDANYSSRN